jgi:hypothetical protein
MANYKYDIKMPDKCKSLLLRMIKSAKSKDVVEGTRIYYDNNCHIQFGIGEDEIEIPAGGREFSTLEHLGLVELNDETSFFITPLAGEWADYQHKNRVTKWLARLSGETKDIILAISFILTLLLTILQILQIFKVIPFK